MSSIDPLPSTLTGRRGAEESFEAVNRGADSVDPSLTFTLDEISSQLATMGIVDLSPDQLRRLKADIDKLILLERTGGGTDDVFAGATHFQLSGLPTNDGDNVSICLSDDEEDDCGDCEQGTSEGGKRDPATVSSSSPGSIWKTSTTNYCNTTTGWRDHGRLCCPSSCSVTPTETSVRSATVTCSPLTQVTSRQTVGHPNRRETSSPSPPAHRQTPAVNVVSSTGWATEEREVNQSQHRTPADDDVTATAVLVSRRAADEPVVDYPTELVHYRPLTARRQFTLSSSTQSTTTTTSTTRASSSWESSSAVRVSFPRQPIATARELENVESGRRKRMMPPWHSHRLHDPVRGESATAAGGPRSRIVKVTVPCRGQTGVSRRPGKKRDGEVVVGGGRRRSSSLASSTSSAVLDPLEDHIVRQTAGMHRGESCDYYSSAGTGTTYRLPCEYNSNPRLGGVLDSAVVVDQTCTGAPRRVKQQHRHPARGGKALRHPQPTAWSPSGRRRITTATVKTARATPQRGDSPSLSLLGGLPDGPATLAGEPRKVLRFADDNHVTTTSSRPHSSVSFSSSSLLSAKCPTGCATSRASTPNAGVTTTNLLSSRRPSDPVAKYQGYQRSWLAHLAPGENARRLLRWNIKTAMMHREVPLLQRNSAEIIRLLGPKAAAHLEAQRQQRIKSWQALASSSRQLPV